MKNKNIIYSIIGFVALVAVAVVASNFFSSQQPPVQETINLTQSVYFIEKESSQIKSEEREIGGTTLLEMLNNTVEQMKISPKSEALISAIPDEVEVLGIDLEEGVAKIDVSSTYLNLKTGEEMLFRAAVVWTFTDFYFVDEVEIYIEGEPLVKSNGEPFGAMGRDDLIIDAQIEAEPTTTTRVIKLYFADSNAMDLSVEERRVEINQNNPIEKYILEQLIIGPKNSDNMATVPAETKIRDVQTLDGICYVDLSQDFVTKHNGGSTGEYFTIYSIVNSLCELEEVEKVQFLIEGEKQDEFKGHLEFSKPFSPIPMAEEDD